MTTLIRAQGPRDLLAYVPYRLGYRPRDSVVLVGLRPPRGRIGLVVRVDVSDVAELEHGPQLARTLVGHLVADGAQRTVLVVYTDAPLRADGAAATPVRAAVEHCRDAVEPLHGPVDVWVVSSTGWYALDCREDDCCPPGGRPLHELESSEVGAHMVLAGTALADSREAALRIPRAPADARRRAARAARRVQDRAPAPEGGRPGASGDAACLAEWRSAVDLAAASARTAGSPTAGSVPATVLGRLAAGLGSVPVRDAVLVSLVPGTRDLADRTVRGGDVDAGTGRAIAALVDPVAGVAPDPAVTDPARAVLEAVVGHAPRGCTAPALTLLALVAWWHGDGGRAGRRLEEALAEDPTYRLALLLSSALDAGVPPGWIRGDVRAGAGGFG
ncbi:DUF4192 domain-containing protein [Cellulosimicrobium protaetiae]|uniref:DUF4192 domain-containing protein n=1 Tax=Cellulosimicrobium protaetiae TaxID=2587808 RepID=A0A6M5UDG4_9MICO|nr:DUF4192 domain-containing protein [Cellulosimicrobium protaetiae]QJW36566.1 DUF4192 domain-containing protein [Cellulosimicrobium protaetiae]